MKFEAEYPDGRREVLLDVPRYEFDWQNLYVLAEPKPMPEGTILRCEAHFDNSAENPQQPGPEAGPSRSASRPRTRCTSAI